jgi:hypothetical protein
LVGSEIIELEVVEGVTAAAATAGIGGRRDGRIARDLADRGATAARP